MKEKFNQFKKWLNGLGTIGLYQWFGIDNPFSSSFETIDGTVGKVHQVIGIATPLSALVAVGLIIYGGILMITSAGDAEKVDQGTKAITAAIIGMIIVFIARLIILFLVDELLA